MAVPEDKVCASCGRRFAWRRKWARNWDDVRYCSDACRRRKLTDLDRRLEAALLDALRHGPVDPSVVSARVDGAGADPEPVRRAARRLVAAGQAELVQRGRVVDPSDVRGDFTLRARPGASR